MNRRQIPFIILLGICCGALLSLAYINPYYNEILFSELVLQLSGSRGNIVLGVSPPELLSFCAELTPYFLFELYIGTNLYRHFCTASVYIFSRATNRIVWYLKESITIIFLAMLYLSSLLLTSTIVAAFRYEIRWDSLGFVLFISHAAIYTCWIYTMTLLVNLLSIVFGSEIAFVLTLGGQSIMVMLLALLRVFENNYSHFQVAIKVNPISRLIIGWQSLFFDSSQIAFGSQGYGLSIITSLELIFVLSIFVFVSGAVLVYKLDIITADFEFGGT